MNNKKAQIGLFVFLLIAFAVLLLFTVFYVYNSSPSDSGIIKTGAYSLKVTSNEVINSFQSLASKVMKRSKSADVAIYPCKFGESDIDGDDVPDYCDSCPMDYDPYQLDYDHDGIGNVCDHKRD